MLAILLVLNFLVKSPDLANRQNPLAKKELWWSNGVMQKLFEVES